MRRTLAVIVISAAVPAATVSASPAAPKASSRTARVTLAECHPSADMDQRFASFSGQMHAIPGTKRMAMHFTLLERLGGRFAPFKAVSLSDLKAWRRSKPGARTFIYTQRVTALHDGGTYRMRVRFRWYGSHKPTLRTLTLRSRSCRQPAPLPNLTITSVKAAPSLSPDQRVYSITVANDGAGDARNIPVELKVDGVTAGSAQVDLLPGEESAVVQILGPQCGFAVRAVADPDRAIRETDDSDNAVTVPCAQTAS